MKIYPRVGIFFVGLGMFVSSVLGCDGRPRQGRSLSSGPRSGPAIAVVDLAGGAPEQQPSGLLGVIGRKRSFDELVGVLDELTKEKDDRKHAGVLVKFGSTNLGAARLQEIAEHLEQLRKKKKVYCHGDSFTNLTFMAAARGCSSIYVSPAGDIQTVGIAAQVVYMRRLLADELNLSIDFLQVGKYKGAEEPITRDGPSPEARASLTGVLVDMRSSWLDTITKGRTQAGVVDAVEEGPYGSGRAKALGLVDEVGYADDAFAAIKGASGGVREEVVFGPGADERGDDLDEIVRALAGESDDTGPVALLRATGSISMTSGENGILGGRSGIIEKDFDRIVRRLEKDDEVKAVVLRIDSPGGSALASDLMWHHLMLLRKAKPLVVSVGDMAASGGMYLASAGDFIFAEPMSIVGSIGVVGGKIGVGNALEKVGVHAETFPANTQKEGAAARAAYESVFTHWDDATRERMREAMTAVYDLFLARVSEGRSTRGRNIARDQVAESAEGRIFSGLQGKSRGLVDEIGGLSAAIAKARELAGLPANAHVAVVGTKPSLLEVLDPQSGAAEEVHHAVAFSPIHELERAEPEVARLLTSMAPLAEGERSVVAVPFVLTVR
ncbi:MAG: S49 family peptidase [Polyangiaceae bacterium]|nr:S49 family peptidase [Polyangiaceae bacterium]